MKVRLSMPSSKILRLEVFDISSACAISVELLRFSTVVARIDRTYDRVFQWEAGAAELGRGGHFHGRVSAECGSSETEWQFVPDSATYDEYSRGCLTAEPIGPSRLPLLSAPSPYSHIAVIRHRNGARRPDTIESVGLPELPEFRQVWTSDRDVWCSESIEIHSTSGGYLNDDGSQSFVSGYSTCGGQRLVGSDIARVLDRSSEGVLTTTATGDFVCVRVENQGGVDLLSDYFGAGVWFEFRGRDVDIWATSYLLAIKVAVAYRERLELNFSTIDANFTSLVQPFQQPILNNLDLKGFRAVPPSEVIHVSPLDGVKSLTSAIGADTLAPERLTMAGYNALRTSAAKELRDCCLSLLRMDVEEVRCDISGGLDSRMVLAGFLAAARTDPKLRSKLTLFTSNAAPTEGDESIALAVAQRTGLPFSVRGVTRVQLSESEKAAASVSAHFGSYWFHGDGYPLLWDNRLLLVGGGGVDDISRNYVVSHWKVGAQAGSVDVADISDSLARQVFRWRGSATLKAAPYGSTLVASEEFESLAGSVEEKASQLFNYHRARFHSHGFALAQLGHQRAFPGRVRSLYRLRLMTGEIFQSPVVQMSIIDQLAPELSDIPYSSALYNSQWLALHGGVGQQSLDGVELDAGCLRRARRAQALALRTVENSGYWYNGDEFGDEFGELSVQRLARQCGLEQVMFPVWKAIREGELSSDYVRTLRWKVLHLCALCRLIEYSRS